MEDLREDAQESTCRQEEKNLGYVANYLSIYASPLVLEVASLSSPSTPMVDKTPTCWPGEFKLSSGSTEHTSPLGTGSKEMDLGRGHQAHDLKSAGSAITFSSGYIPREFGFTFGSFCLVLEHS